MAAAEKEDKHITSDTPLENTCKSFQGIQRLCRIIIGFYLIYSSYMMNGGDVSQRANCRTKANDQVNVVVFPG